MGNKHSKADQNKAAHTECAFSEQEIENMLKIYDEISDGDRW